MEMKDVVLSALAEIQTLEQEIAVMTKGSTSKEETQAPKHVIDDSVEDEGTIEHTSQAKESALKTQKETSLSRDEADFLNKLRERLLVLFEGFQSPNNKNLEAKVDLTLNFLEYSLAVIDDRIEKHKSRPKF